MMNDFSVQGSSLLLYDLVQDLIVHSFRRLPIDSNFMITQYSCLIDFSLDLLFFSS